MAPRAAKPAVEGAIKPLLKQVLTENRVKPPLTAESYLRISSLAMMCAREEAICVDQQIHRDDPISADTMMLFEHGHALHWGLQNRMLPLTAVLVGRWRCTQCGHTVGGRERWVLPLPEDWQETQIPRPSHCEGCSSEMTSDTCLYEEQHFVDSKHRLMGHPDGFLRMGSFKRLGVLEIKSIGFKGAWEVRGCPKMEHVVQLQCYMWLTGCIWGKVLYWDKAGGGLGALIEHTLESDDEQIEAIQELIRQIWLGVSGGPLPERICGTVSCARASECPVAIPCFEGASS
jgi:hypothetical protein